MLRWVFIKTKWVHKYLGLALILYGVLMGVTGILVNHPEWIESFSIPTPLVPNQYRPQNWNRDTLAGVRFDQTDPQHLYAFGESGIWESNDAGRSFESLTNKPGFPAAPYLRKTNDLLIIHPKASAPDSPRILAATRAGLFQLQTPSDPWHRISLGPIDHGLVNDTSKDDEVLSLLRRNENEIIAVIRDGFFLGYADHSAIPFHPLNTTRAKPFDESTGRIKMIRFLFDLHSGRILGLEGRLLFDVVGITIVLLCFSAFYLWYYPKRIRRARQKRRSIRTGRLSRTLFKQLFYYHLKIGVWVTPVLLIMAFTGFFMRPPPIILPARITVPAWWHPLQSPQNQWTGRIKRAAFDPATEQLLVECTDGFWRGPADFTKPFQPTRIGLPVHIMGSTVLTYDDHYGLIAGSFCGIYNRNRIKLPQDSSGNISQQKNRNRPNGAESTTETIKHRFREENQARHHAENHARYRALRLNQSPGAPMTDTDTDTDTAVVDTTTGQHAQNVSTLRLGTHMVTGFFRTPQGDEYIATFRDGLIHLNRNNSKVPDVGASSRTSAFHMPEQIVETYRMSLWEYAFELHNGRFFRDWLGSAYLVIPILGSLLFFLLTLSGIFDWTYIQLTKAKL